MSGPVHKAGPLPEAAAVPSAEGQGRTGGAEKTVAILGALKRRYSDQIWGAELALSQGSRRCDFWTLHPHRSKGYLAEAFEIKVSRADWKRDSHEKQRESRLYSDRFWYVTPARLLKREEVPDWAGLMEYRDDGFFPVVSAPHRDKDAPSWELVVSLIRNGGEINRETDIMKERLRYLERENKRLQESDWKLRQQINDLYNWKLELEGVKP